MLGAVASGFYADIPDAMNAMSRIGKTVTPQANKSKRYYDAKYRVFQQMYTDDCRYKEMMTEF